MGPYQMNLSILWPSEIFPKVRLKFAKKEVVTIAAENVNQIAEHAIVNLPIAVTTVVVTIHVVEGIHVATESVMHVARPFVVACLNSFLLYSVIFFVPTIRPSHYMLKFLESYEIKTLVPIFNNTLTIIPWYLEKRPGLAQRAVRRPSGS